MALLWRNRKFGNRKSGMSSKAMKSLKRGIIVSWERMTILVTYEFGANDPKLCGLNNQYFIECHIFVGQGFRQDSQLGSSVS